MIVDDINVSDVDDILLNNNTVGIIWYSKECPTCQIFFQDWLTASNIVIYARNWKFYKIAIEDHEMSNVVKFEPEVYPMGYFFKDGKRLKIMSGKELHFDLPDELQMMESDSFKTNKEKEIEQLNILSNL